MAAPCAADTDGRWRRENEGEQYVITVQTAGMGAALAVTKKLAVSDDPVEELRAKLPAQKAVLSHAN